jgi:intermediate peptidase
VVRGLDRVSDTICSIADAAELCANVHPDPAWITGADTAIGMLSEYLNKLNTSQELYELASFAVNSKFVPFIANCSHKLIAKLISS